MTEATYTLGNTSTQKTLKTTIPRTTAGTAKYSTTSTTSAQTK